MSWTSPADIEEQVLRYWRRGDILAAPLSGRLLFPLEIRLK